jgi:hypothetical protein
MAPLTPTLRISSFPVHAFQLPNTQTLDQRSQPHSPPLKLIPMFMGLALPRIYNNCWLYRHWDQLQWRAMMLRLRFQRIEYTVPPALHFETVHVEARQKKRGSDNLMKTVDLRNDDGKARTRRCQAQYSGG